MFKRYRLSYFAGILGVLLLIFGNYVALAEPDNEFIPLGVEIKPGKDQSRAHTVMDSSASKHGKQYPAPYKSNCKEPKNAEEADLCEQGRMAKAAEDLLDRTDTQIDLSKYEIGGLLLTLFFTGVAAIAAVMAARSADQAIAVASDNSKTELRAYLSAEPAGVNQLIGRTTCMGHVSVRNVGKIPARDVEVIVHMTVTPKNDIELPEPGTPWHSTRVIQPDAAMVQGSQECPVKKIDRAGQYVFVWGVVLYHDGYEPDRFTKFCHRYDTGSRNQYSSLRGPTKTRIIIDPEKARYHLKGNEAT